MKTKNEICVNIRNEKELQQAREILLRNREHICPQEFKLNEQGNKDLDYLFYSKHGWNWVLCFKVDETEIPLSELESVLRGESESKKQSSIEWMFDEIKRRQEIIFSEPDGITRETMIDCLSNGLIEQAKQMHREEIEDAINTGHGISTNVNINFDFYYNKTFKND